LAVKCPLMHLSHYHPHNNAAKPDIQPVADGQHKGAALLVDEVLPREPVRQWVLSFPFQLRFLFASYPELTGKIQ